MIDRRQDISPVEKMAYLRECVRDTAKTGLSQLPMSGASYNDAVKLLKECFGARKADERMALSHLESITASDDSWNSQLSLVLPLKGAVMKMSRQQPNIQQDMILQQVVLRKFPINTRTKLIEFIYDKEEVTITEILNRAEDIVKKELFIAEMSTRQHTKAAVRQTINLSNMESSIDHTRNGSNRTNPKFEPLVANDDKACVFCGKHKLSWECRTIPLVKDRISFIKERGWCQSCLKAGGTVRQCSRRCPICDGPHDISLCFKLVIEKGSKKNRSSLKKPERNDRNRNWPRNHERKQEHQTISKSLIKDEGNFSKPAKDPQSQHIGQIHSILPQREISLETRLQTGKLIVVGAHRRSVDFILDTGASMSLVSEEMAIKMKLKRVRRTFSKLCGLGGVSSGNKEYTIYEVPLEGTDGSTIIVEAMGHSDPITSTMKYDALPQQDVSFIKTRKLQLADEYGSSSITNPAILLGIKECFKVLHLAKKPIKLPSGYLLMSSIFGWIAAGEPEFKTLKSDGQQTIYHLSERKQYEREVNKAVEKFLAVDEVVKTESGEDKLSTQESSIVDEYFRANVSLVDNKVLARYCMRENLLQRLSKNLNSSVARLRNVVINLQAKGMLDHYHRILMDHLEKKKIEVVCNSSDESSVAYLPHHPVFREDKETKPIRIVFDASAKEKGKLSLNECMYTGEVNLERIPALLIRARLSPSILLCDVEAAFLQIGIKEDQRDWMRFIWLKGPRKPIRDTNIVHYRFTVAPFGIAQSPYLLESSIRHQIEREESRLRKRDNMESFVLEQLKHNLYVDNVIFECEEETEKEELYATARRFFSEISMNLREFASESTEFINSIPEQDRGKVGLQKILGLPWSSTSDTLILKATVPVVKGMLTKRKVLKKLASSFDPLGLLTVVLLPAKVFVQQLWTKSYGWDTILSEEDTSAWNRIEEEISKFELHVPRRLNTVRDSCTLVAFADASTKAMGAAVYVVDHKEGSLLIARSQLAPVRNKQTIPRLELKALLLASKLLLFTVKSIRRTHPTLRVKCALFTDSIIALYWAEDRIKNSKGSRAVLNMSKEITATRCLICRTIDTSCSTPTTCVKLGHVKTEENPADLATRGCSSNKLQNEGHLWWKGPSWLTVSGVSNLPPWDPDETPEEVEIQAKMLNSPQPILFLGKGEMPTTPVQFSRFSSYIRLRNTVAHVRRFIRKWFLKKCKNTPPKIERIAGKGPTVGPITVLEMKEAESCIIKMHQLAHLSSIKSPGNHKFALFIDSQGIYRCGDRRLKNYLLSTDEKYPIFIPGNKKEPLISMMVRHVNVSALHAGENHTMDLLRSSFWIVRARRAVRYTLRRCITCRRTIAQPFKYPAAPELPPERVNPSRPFKATGVDFAGPFTIRMKAEITKVYVLLFTCLSTRAAHLEVTKSLSSTSFLAAFKRFIARRGVPESLLSDNAPAFKNAETLLSKDSEESDLFQSYCATRGISWHFTAPHAPWQGGVYERLIGIVKMSMVRSFGRRVLDEDEFTTAVTEIEAIINTRPLIRLSDDPKDRLRVLRPADFLTPGASLGIFPRIITSEDDYAPPDSTADALTKQHIGTQAQMQRYWELFLSSYIGSLSGKQDASVKQGKTSSHSPNKGDIVLIKEECTPRGSWPIGRVLDYTERQATVRSSSGRIITRPLSLLIPLELGCHEEETPQRSIPDEDLPKTKESRLEEATSRPQRSCKSLARDPGFWEALR